MRHQMMVGAALAAISFSCLAQQYEIHDLGKAGGIGSTALDVNKKLLAVGVTGWPGDELWRPGIFSIDQPAMAIYTPGPGTANSVNKKGEVVGQYEMLTGGYGFIWKNNQLFTLPSNGWRWISPNAINDKSDIVGSGALCCSDPSSHAWKYSNGKLVDLGTWGGSSAYAVAINKHGDMAGYRTRYTAAGASVMEGIRIIDGKRHVLKSGVSGGSVQLTSMNDSGDVAGNVYQGAGSDARAFVLIDNKSQIINAAQAGTANSINNKGQVVGSFRDAGSSGEYAFLWENGRTVELSNLPEVRAAGWMFLQRATAISDEGVIVGLGFNASAQGHAFMLVPRKGHPDQAWTR